jgi:superfamily II DNA or RNA helicase/HKD family nuclease
MNELSQGLYDLLITEYIDKRIKDTNAHDEGFKHSAAQDLVAELARRVYLILESLPETKERPLDQTQLVNELLMKFAESIKGQTNNVDDEILFSKIISPPRRLCAIHPADRKILLPETGLRAPWLFTASKDTPSLLSEIRRELASADQVDILVSFITVSGVRKLLDIFREVTALGTDSKNRTRLRILTTTYTGATDAKAVDQLASLPGCEVKVSLDGRRTRLHAKAWIFHRKTGFGSTYIGSANLSGAALTGGLEWTVKLSQRDQGPLFERAKAHFETLWADPEFSFHDPRNEDHRRRLRAALAKEKGLGASSFDNPVIYFDLSPKAYQQEMLDQLAIEREHGRTRNLVVAATGTGKTMVAAFDYKRLCEEYGGRPKLLFVAHREEILKQAMQSYRAVLRDAEFGELLTGNDRPQSYHHLFATIQSVTSRALVEQLGADYWYQVVIDECHHIAAKSFSRLIGSISPEILLGLTATPERGDGQPIHTYFDSRPDGSPAVELRLWDALDMQLLAPFEYYACDDPTDLRSVPWQRAGESKALEEAIAQNRERAEHVIRVWQELVVDPRECRTLVFCVSVDHARFMADVLNEADIAAAYLTGQCSNEKRRSVNADFRAGKLAAVTTVDLFNEGVDFPNVDTLLLLRPTQSPVVFQQQMGRGLRLAKGKESCLVLDFVGQHSAEYRYDLMLAALTGLPRQRLITAILEGFDELPPGCHVHLQKQTREQILSHLKLSLNNRWRSLAQELTRYASIKKTRKPRLAEFVREQGVELEDIYRSSKPRGWTRLKADANIITREISQKDVSLADSTAALIHHNDPRILNVMLAIGRDGNRFQPSTRLDAVRAQMLVYQLFHDYKNEVGPYSRFVEKLQNFPELCDELVELSLLLLGRTTQRYSAISGLENQPLCLHAQYQLREILTAIGKHTEYSRPAFREGVYRDEARRIEYIFVTLDKSVGFHESIAYRDYAIAPHRFHWQSQNSARPETAAGRRYVNAPDNGWSFQLFIRENKNMPYVACGPGVIVNIEGEAPMSITFELRHPLSASLFRKFSLMKGA